MEKIGESLIKLEKEDKKVDPEKFMSYIRSHIKDKDMYYLLLDEVQMLDCFESVLNVDGVFTINIYDFLLNMDCLEK